jgi:transcriptional regulator of acetoin/glycerol metabolism
LAAAQVGGPTAPHEAAGAVRQAETSLASHKAGERERMLEALAASNWNRLRAAELVGMPRRTFYRRLKEYGIQ